MKKSVKGRRQHRGKRLVPVALGLVIATALAAVLGIVLWDIPASTRISEAVPPEPTDQCRTTPQFTANPAILGAATNPGAGAFNTPATIALSTEGREKGLVLIAGETQAPYQHATWDDAGYLGAIAYDRGGNIYAAPTPRLSLVDNPLAGVTSLWRVDSATAEMRPFATIPGSANERNPFGVLGLFYACDNDTLYAGSVVGSTPSTENGGVIAIHIPDGTTRTILNDIDVMGVLVVRQGDAVVLYAGLARSPDIIAVHLDKQGLATGPISTLIDLTTAGATPQERARKLRLVDGTLVADLVPFSFSLQSNASNIPQVRRATWEWDATKGGWIVQQEARSGS